VGWRRQHSSPLGSAGRNALSRSHLTTGGTRTTRQPPHSKPAGRDTCSPEQRRPGTRSTLRPTGTSSTPMSGSCSGRRISREAHPESLSHHETDHANAGSAAGHSSAPRRLRRRTWAARKRRGWCSAVRPYPAGPEPFCESWESPRNCLWNWPHAKHGLDVAAGQAPRPLRPGRSNSHACTSRTSPPLPSFLGQGRRRLTANFNRSSGTAQSPQACHRR
jgi:hypothetical protein